MDFLLEALTNWLKEMLVGGIMSNLSGMFDSVNQQVADISVQVGQTPQGWNGSIFNMIENLSNSIMVPIAGVILAIVMTVDLIQMIADNRRRVDEERQELQTLVSDISHQVKTPVSNLKMATDTLLEKPMTEAERTDFIRGIRSQTDKLDFLFQALVKTSRLETGVIQLDKKPGRLFDTVAQAMSGIVYAAEKKETAVSVDCPEDLTVSHDSKWTSEALFNLLDNAVNGMRGKRRCHTSRKPVWERKATILPASYLIKQQYRPADMMALALEFSTVSVRLTWTTAFRTAAITPRPPQKLWP